MEVVLGADGEINSVCTSIMQLDSKLYQIFMFATEEEQSKIVKESKKIANINI